MHHPVKDYWMERSSRRVTGLLCGDRSPQAESGMRLQHFALSVGRWRAEIYMLVPLRHAQRNALVELIFAETLGRGIHHSDQFVIVAMFLVEQRGGMFRIEVKCGFHAVAIISEVIHFLRDIGQKDLEPIG